MMARTAVILKVNILHGSSTTSSYKNISGLFAFLSFNILHGSSTTSRNSDIVLSDSAMFQYPSRIEHYLKLQKDGWTIIDKVFQYPSRIEQYLKYATSYTDELKAVGFNILHGSSTTSSRSGLGWNCLVMFQYPSRIEHYLKMLRNEKL